MRTWCEPSTEGLNFLFLLGFGFLGRLDDSWSLYRRRPANLARPNTRNHKANGNSRAHQSVAISSSVPGFDRFSRLGNDIPFPQVAWKSEILNDSCEKIIHLFSVACFMSHSRVGPQPGPLCQSGLRCYFRVLVPVLTVPVSPNELKVTPGEPVPNSSILVQSIMSALFQKCPHYIPIARIAIEPVDYQWDLDSPFSLVDFARPQTVQKLEEVSERALVAYSLANCEWVMYRLSRRVDDLIPYYYTEAFWAYVMGRESLFEYPPELDHSEWSTYERNPIDCAISTVMNVVYMSQYYESPVNDAARTEQLVKHVLKEPNPYIEWESIVLDRLTTFFPRNGGKREGDPIPRQIMDPTVAYRHADRKKLIDANYYQADFGRNPFKC